MHSVTSGASNRKTRATLFVMLIVLIMLGSYSSYGKEVDPVSITADYPGGNIIVERVEGDTVFLRTDLRDTERWWFYWNFKVKHAQGRTVTFKFTERNPVGVLGPAVKEGNEIPWRWLGKRSVSGASFSYTFPEESTTIQFAFAVPYLDSDLKKWITYHKDSDALRVGPFCTSAQGRKVTYLKVGCIKKAPHYYVLLTARHHACESMASFVLEGLLSAVLAEDEIGAWFQDNVFILAIPFMDTDGVENGDQGKSRRPRDHNRDYIGESIHPEVAAIRDMIPGSLDSRLKVALDLHCPYISGKHNEEIYIVGSPDAAIWKQQQIFGALLEENNTSPLPYYASSNLPFGQAWNTSTNYSAGKSFGRWAGELEGISLAASLEIPYANASGEAVTPESARAFGESLAKTIKTYLESL